MPETNDINAHQASINVQPDSVDMLNGQRFNSKHRFADNQWYRIPETIWNNIKNDFSNDGTGAIPILQWYLRNHADKQDKRILDLQRYYLVDNDVHYWRSNKVNRADNRIASAYARYITNFKNGLLLGKPLKYNYSNPKNDNDDGEDLINKLRDFSSSVDERHHNNQLGRDCLVTGRGYELMYVQANTNIPMAVKINPNQCFVIWSTDVEPKELVAVRYYMVRVANQRWYQIEVYTPKYIRYYQADAVDSNWQFLNQEDNVFSDVPITEYILNDERESCFEPVLDYFDDYDKSLSEMANSQEDFSNMTLVVSGKAHRPQKIVQATDNYGNKLYYKNGKARTVYNYTMQSRDKNGNYNVPVKRFNPIQTKSNMLFLDPATQNGKVVSQPKANYLTKSLDGSEWQTYINQLKQDIQMFTGVPDMSNDDSNGSKTVLETASELMGALENSSEFESNFRHGIVRRIKLLADYWDSVKGNGFTSNDNVNNPTDVTIHFTINLPLNVQETIQKIQALVGSGDISKNTIQHLASTLTGVPQSTEASLLDSENVDVASASQSATNSDFQNEIMASQKASSANSNDNDMSNSVSNSSLNVTNSSNISDDDGNSNNSKVSGGASN